MVLCKELHTNSHFLLIICPCKYHKREKKQKLLSSYPVLNLWTARSQEKIRLTATAFYSRMYRCRARKWRPGGLRMKVKCGRGKADMKVKSVGGVADERKSKQRTGEEGGWDGGSVKWGSRSGMFRHKLSPGNNRTFFFFFIQNCSQKYVYIHIHSQNYRLKHVFPMSLCWNY